MSRVSLAGPQVATLASLVDAEAYRALAAWGEGASASELSQRHAREICSLSTAWLGHDAAQLGELAARCDRLQLLALASKVLRLLGGQSPAGGVDSNVLLVAREWAASVILARGVLTEQHAHWKDALRILRDEVMKAPEPGEECPSASERAEAVRLVIQAVAELNMALPCPAGVGAHERSSAGTHPYQPEPRAEHAARAAPYAPCPGSVAESSAAAAAAPLEVQAQCAFTHGFAPTVPPTPGCAAAATSSRAEPQGHASSAPPGAGRGSPADCLPPRPVDAGAAAHSRVQERAAGLGVQIRRAHDEPHESIAEHRETGAQRTDDSRASSSGFLERGQEARGAGASSSKLGEGFVPRPPSAQKQDLFYSDRGAFLPIPQGAAPAGQPGPGTMAAVSSIRHAVPSPVVRSHGAGLRAGADVFAVSCSSGPESYSHRSVGSRRSWTPEEEQRLVEGYRSYGSAWETIRKNYALTHRTGVQLKDKYRNLQKAGVPW